MLSQLILLQSTNLNKVQLSNPATGIISQWADAIADPLDEITVKISALGSTEGSGAMKRD